MVGELASAEHGLEHGRARLLDLEEQRVSIVSPEHQHDPAAGADTPDTDDLSGQVDVTEALQQLAPVPLQRPSVGANELADRVLELGHVELVGQLGDGDDERRIGHDARHAVDVLRQARERLHAVLRACFGRGAGNGSSLRHVVAAA